MAPVTLTARLVGGLGEAASFTGAGWVRDAFIALLGIDPYPGTVNLQVETEAQRAAWQAILARPGIVIEAPDPKWCNARAYPVTVGQGTAAVEGAIVFPEVPGYPEDKVEIIAAVGVRAALSLCEGDMVTVTVGARDQVEG